jgi:hypothetical protein
MGLRCVHGNTAYMHGNDEPSRRLGLLNNEPSRLLGSRKFCIGDCAVCMETRVNENDEPSRLGSYFYE